MRTSTTLSALAIVASLSPASSLGAQPERFELLSGSTLWIEGTSTVRGWTCRTSTMSAVVELASSRSSDVVAGSANRLEVEVPTRTLDCGNGRMNKDMFDALQANTHPFIRYSLIRYELVPGTATNDSATVRAIGSLEIAGTTKEVALDVRASRDGHTVRGQGKIALRMTDFGVKPPSTLRGLIKAGDRITVNFDIRGGISPLVALAWDAAAAAR